MFPAKIQNPRWISCIPLHKLAGIILAERAIVYLRRLDAAGEEFLERAELLARGETRSTVAVAGKEIPAVHNPNIRVPLAVLADFPLPSLN